MQNYGIFHFPFNFTASSHCTFARWLPSALYRKSGESLLWSYLLLNFTSRWKKDCDGYCQAIQTEKLNEKAIWHGTCMLLSTPSSGELYGGSNTTHTAGSTSDEQQQPPKQLYQSPERLKPQSQRGEGSGAPSPQPSSSALPPGAALHPGPPRRLPGPGALSPAALPARGPPHLGAPQPPQRARSRRPADRGTAPAEPPPCRGAGPAASAPGRAPCEAPGLWWKRLRSRVRPARWRRRPAQLWAWGCRWRAERGRGGFKGSGTPTGFLMGVGSIQGCGEGSLGEVRGWCGLPGG